MERRIDQATRDWVTESESFKMGKWRDDGKIRYSQSIPTLGVWRGVGQTPANSQEETNDLLQRLRDET